MKPFFLALALLFSGLYFMGKGISGVFFTQEARSWPVVQGTVHAKNVWVRSGRHGSKDYIPLIRYYYEVNGAAYTSEKLCHANLSASSKADALEMLSSYSVGMPATVHYDPHDPSNAVLQIDSISSMLVKAGLGLVLFLLGLLAGLPLWRDFNSNRFYDASESAF